MEDSSVVILEGRMLRRSVPGKFLVAFSFAGEQREQVRSIANEVEAVLGPSTVFFDEWYEFFIAGHDADLRLQRIYQSCSELVVVCVSEEYGRKAWTGIEHETIRERLMRARRSGDRREREGILPIRVGAGEVEGIPNNAIVPDARHRSPRQVAEIILQRLHLVAPASVPNDIVMYGDPSFILSQQSEPYPEASRGFAVVARSSREPRIVPVNVCFLPKGPGAKSAVPDDRSLLKMKSSALAIVGKYKRHLTGQLKKIFDERYWRRELITIPNMAFESLRALTAATAGAYMMEFLREVLESDLNLPVDFPARMALCVGGLESASALAGLKDTVQPPSCIVIYGFGEGAGSETSYTIDTAITSQYAEGLTDVLDFVFQELITVVETKVWPHLLLETDRTLRDWVQAEVMRDSVLSSSANLRARLYELEQAIVVKSTSAKYLTDKIKQLEEDKRDGKPATSIEMIRESYREHEVEVRRRFYSQRQDEDEADTSGPSSAGPSTKVSEPTVESAQQEGDDGTGPEEQDYRRHRVRKLYKRVARLFHPDTSESDKHSPEWWSAQINRHRDDEVFLLAAETLVTPLSKSLPNTPLIVAACGLIDRLFDIRAVTLEAARKADLLKVDYTTLSEIQKEWSQEGIETLKRQEVARKLEREIDCAWRRLEVLSNPEPPPDLDRNGLHPSDD